MASDSAAGRLSGDGLAGATRGNPDVEAGGALANRGGKVTNSKVFEPILTVQNLKFHKAT